MIRLALFLAVGCLPAVSFAGDPLPSPTFSAGYAERDITPKESTPMWGYGARHDALSQGTLDPLMAKALVIQAGDQRLAIVGTDLGRGPTTAMMERIRRGALEQAGVQHVLVGGSHSHHGPVIELTDAEGLGRGKFDAAVRYVQGLPDEIVAVVREASAALKPARIGVAVKDVALNRNRHSKRLPKPVDPMLAVVRCDTLDGQPIAVLVNFAAHPVMTSGSVLKFSADYPGFMMRRVEAELKSKCLFMQGASGDLSPDPSQLPPGPQPFGEAMADHVIELAGSVKTAVPNEPRLQAKVDRFRFRSRVDFSNPLIVAGYQAAFFPELIRNFVAEFREGVRPELNTVLVNGELAIVAGSGEFFCNHARRLKERSYVPHTLFFGYCNGHDLYFPTIEAASELGYGADPTVSPVEVGAGEQMMNRALINIYTLVGRFPEAVDGRR